MPSITVTVDDETYRLVSIRATELGTTAPELLREYLAVFARRSPREPSASATRGNVSVVPQEADTSDFAHAERLRALAVLPLEDRRRILRDASIEVDAEEIALWDHLPWSDELGDDWNETP